MKSIIAIAALVIGLSAHAYEPESCRLHQDYEGQEFTVGATLIDYFEPRERSQDFVDAQFALIPLALQQQLVDLIGIDDLAWVDDLTLEEIHFRGEALLRFNVGVGGGNGLYATYRKLDGGHQLLSYVFDGDVEFCHASVGKY